MLFSRTDTSLFSHWWWTVDRWLLAGFGFLILIGSFLVITASSAVAERIGLNASHFALRHFAFLVPALLLMFGLSLLTPRQILLAAMALFVLSLAGLLMTLFFGHEIKGAQRWIRLFGFSLQPSEFVKPGFLVLNAWLLAQPGVRASAKGWALPVILLLLVTSLLLLQPDFGMTAVVVIIWMGQLFIAGLPVALVVMGGVACMAGVGGGYFVFPHVASRIDRFLNPASGDTYQVERALDAFRAGGLFGVGPGMGVVKEQIPDAHADFIFAVGGEELGLIGCVVLLGLIAFIVMRGFWCAGRGPTLFVALAASGLIIQFAMQSLINIGSSLHLLPTKGMTLPFVSYGGSSLLAVGIGMGMLLGLTRKRTHKI